MVDRKFAEPHLARLYDPLCELTERGDFGFYLPLVLSASAVLDVGCGTGALLHRARQARHTGRLVGLDPAPEMLEVAGARRDIEWVLGNLSTTRCNHEFDLAVISGHAFQVFVTDEELRTSLATIRKALVHDGAFAFETRNPLAREWARWRPENGVDFTSADGSPVRCETEVTRPFDGDTVTFAATYSCVEWDTPEVSESTLRFLDADSLAHFLAEAGFRIEEQLGDWDRSPLTDLSPEVITVARPV